MGTVLVVDAANVVGSRPDGWWRDRPGAARRLHERLLTADLPYDRFLTEQLAGDELADPARVSRSTPEFADPLIATGFLRTAIDPTVSPELNFPADRYQVLADTVEVVSSSLLGLTLRCARCHSHKYDPIPQRDYYRLLDVFKGAFDEHDWLRPSSVPGQAKSTRAGRLLTHVTAEERQRWDVEKTRLQKEIAKATLALYFEPDKGVLPKKAEIDMRGLAQVIGFMAEGGTIRAPLPAAEKPESACC